MTTRSVTLTGMISEASSSANESWTQRRIILSRAEELTVTSVRVDHAEPAIANGATTSLVLSPAARVSTGGVAVNILAAGTSAASVTCSIAISANTPLYLWVLAAGGHSNVEVVIEYTLNTGESVSAPPAGLEASTVLLEARNLLQDTSGAWWTDTVMLSYLSGAQYRLASKRPTTLLYSYASLGALQPVTATSDLLLTDARFCEGLALYVAAKCLAEDNADTMNLSKSKLFMEMALDQFTNG